MDMKWLFCIFRGLQRLLCALRWLKTVFSTYICMGRYNHSLSLDATIMVSKNCPILGEDVGIIFVTQYVTIATDKMQPLAKFKKIMYMGFRATLNFRKIKVALNPMYRIFLNFAKSCNLSCSSKVDNIKKFHRAVFEI